MFSDELQKFLHRSIKSVWALELLLLLRRHNDAGKSVDELTRELRGSRALVVDILTSLARDGLAHETSPGIFAYNRRDPESDKLVEELERLYVERPLALVKAILAAPNDKIQIFADAFKLKRD